jgi:hypothetical protein
MTGQQSFAAALLDPDRPAPAGLCAAGEMKADGRFDVYRNNVVTGLIDALAAGFPVTSALVGEDFFRAMAGAFVRRHPPDAPILTRYGAGFPAFLERFAPVAHLPYLPDTARLERALCESYHAADSIPIDPQELAEIPADDLASLRLRLAPALRLLRSDWPVHAIWAAHHGGPPPEPGGQELLVARPGFDPVAHLLPAGSVAVVAALQAGESLGQALSRAPEEFHQSNIEELLGLLLGTASICGLIAEATT